MVVGHTEFFGKNAINVFDKTENHSRNFTQSIAQMKTLQGDNQAFYVCDLGSVVQSLQQWFSCLPRISPFYSVRCNDDAVLLRLLTSVGNVGLHCTTREDLETALDMLPSGRILYANPCWTRGSLRNAADSLGNAGLITIETMGDLDRVLVTFPHANILLNVGMTINAEDPTTEEFGCTFEDACEILQRAADSQANICGISFNIGSGCLDPTLYSSAIQTCAELFKIAKTYGLKMDILNVGSGFSNVSKFNQSASFADICNEINSALDYYFPLENFSDLRVIAQPGRFFAEEAFLLSTCIIDKQAVDLSEVTRDDYDLGSQGYIYQINEGYYGAFGQNVPNCEPKCVPLFEDEADNSTSQQYYGNVIGPSLDEFDIAQSMCHLRQMFVGDWLMWPEMGAYSRNNRGSLGDVDIPSPAVYYYCNSNDWECIKRLVSLESTDRPKSIASTQLTTRRSSFALSLLDGSIDETDECYGSLSDFSDAFGSRAESVGSMEDEWMSRWQFQGTIFE
jgi:ornithine decarboxylase